MIKKMIILIVMGLIFSSCQLFTEAIKDNIARIERERERNQEKKMDRQQQEILSMKQE